MSQTFYDALIIGGGPGGSSAAAFLAKAGKRVLVLEKETFPRFHIGESLLPYNHRLFRELGVLSALEAAGFTRKFGAQFHLGNSTHSLKLTFRNGSFTREPMAFQVERARFDQILLNNASAAGAEVREGWTVVKFEREDEQMLVRARGPGGQIEEFRGSFLIDASGRANLTGNHEGLRVVHQHLKKVAMFGHFENVAMDRGDQAGDIVIVRLETKWFWLIPISPTRVSIGCVLDQEEFAAAKLPASELFAKIWQSSTEMRRRMAGARSVNGIQTTTDFSYYNRRLTGPRLMRIGDAAGFMDPIFSAGVYLAMHSAKLASEVVLHGLRSSRDIEPQLRTYEKRVFRAMSYYWEMVEAFYTRPFMELFMQPRRKFRLPDAIVAILAGELEGGWRLEWRRRLFLWLVKLQGRWPLVPRVSFDEMREEPSSNPP